MKRFIGFRLRKQLDDDLFDALKGVEESQISELARTGLRLALNIRTQKVMEIKEMPVQMAARKVWTPPAK